MRDSVSGERPTGPMNYASSSAAGWRTGSLGAVDALTPELREKLTEPNTVVIDESERARLGLKAGVGETGEILGPEGPGGRTDSRLQQPGRALRVLLAAGRPGRCCGCGPIRRRTCWPRRDTPAGAQGPSSTGCERRYSDEMSAFTSEEFSFRSRVALADEDQGRDRDGRAVAVGSAGRGGGDRVHALCGDGGVDPRVRRAAGPGHSAVADGDGGHEPVVLGRRARRGGRPAGHVRLARAAEAAGNLRVMLAPWLLGSVGGHHSGHGPDVGLGRAADSAAGRTRKLAKINLVPNVY